MQSYFKPDGSLFAACQAFQGMHECGTGRLETAIACVRAWMGRAHLISSVVHVGILEKIVTFHLREGYTPYSFPLEGAVLCNVPTDSRKQNMSIFWLRALQVFDFFVKLFDLCSS